MKKISLLLSLLLLSIPNLSYSDEKEEEGYKPLYLGTLLAFFSINIDLGNLCLEPYFYQTTQSGFYNQNWSFKKEKIIHDLTIAILLETGITSWLDIPLLQQELAIKLVTFILGSIKIRESTSPFKSFEMKGTPRLLI